MKLDCARLPFFFFTFSFIIFPFIFCSRRRREESSVQLRKAKKEENCNKRRNLTEEIEIPQVTANELPTSPMKSEVSLTKLHSYVNGMYFFI